MILSKEKIDNMTYKKFQKLLSECKHQFVISTKDNKKCFIRLGKSLTHNDCGCLATNEATFEVEILEYGNIDYNNF